ncbi:MAG: metallophosphoesterase family protein [Proteobacteria bacterium]|nr:metallophosphoesterase family protein [Pseudomonadota bacterium]
MPVTVAILSDTHGYVWPEIIESVSRCDYAIHAGDVGGAHVLSQLQPKKQLLAVRGNNDLPYTWEPDEHHILAGLDHTAELSLPGGSLAVVHGDRAGRVSDRHDNLRKQFPGSRVIVYGHSHQQTLDRDEEPWVINPGAAGRARTYGGPAWMLLSATLNEWRLETFRLDV